MLASDRQPMAELTPRRIVEELDKYIVGQTAAKRAVAIALRNRYRRRALPDLLQNEVTPKNILLIGPTGVGKTEVARRMAHLVHAPFVKVEATKFTEVGYVGRDVDSMVRELMEAAVQTVREERGRAVAGRAAERAEERLLDLLIDPPSPERRSSNPLEAIFGSWTGGPSAPPPSAPESSDRRAHRSALRQELLAGELEGEMVEVEVAESLPFFLPGVTGGPGDDPLTSGLGEALSGMLPRRMRTKRMSVAEARQVLIAEETQKLVDQEQVVEEARRRAEQDGVVFIDEIDKVAAKSGGSGPDVSREGVQRDILPLVEGCTVTTKYGPMKTDHILFIAAGAFHVSKPTDLIPELQGRFPVRVELQPLTQADLRRILVEPENALVRQYVELLATDGVRLSFSEDGLDAVARMAQEVNDATENIGARRLATVMEKLLDDVAFNAPEDAQGEVLVDAAFVERTLGPLVEDRDLRRYIL